MSSIYTAPKVSEDARSYWADGSWQPIWDESRKRGVSGFLLTLLGIVGVALLVTAAVIAINTVQHNQHQQAEITCVVGTASCT